MKNANTDQVNPRDERSGERAIPHAERMLRLAYGWTSARAGHRMIEHRASGDARLPSLVRFFENGRLLRQHQGQNEADALAQAFAAIELERFPRGAWAVVPAEPAWIEA